MYGVHMCKVCSCDWSKSLVDWLAKKGAVYSYKVLGKQARFDRTCLKFVIVKYNADICILKWHIQPEHNIIHISNLLLPIVDILVTHIMVIHTFSIAKFQTAQRIMCQ